MTVGADGPDMGDDGDGKADDPTGDGDATGADPGRGDDGAGADGDPAPGVDASPPDPAEALVVDAASGIGRAVATALAANGLTVVGVDVDEAGLSTVGESLADLPGRFQGVPADLTDDAACEAAVETAADAGDLRYLANVAGLQHIDPIESFPMETYDRLLGVMLRAPFLLSKLALPHVRAAGGGAVGNMCSIHAHVATTDKPAYVVAKFGLRGLTAALAAEGRGTVRSFSVSTSYVSTPLVTDQIPDTAAERGISERAVVEDVMLGGSRVDEMMTPMDVANCFVFGFSGHGRHLNGEDLTLDGGHVRTYE